jgi:regulator of sigma E protease
VIHEVQGGSAAARAGLKAGDRVVQADGRAVTSWARLVDAIQAHPGTPLRLRVSRGGQLLDLTVTPAVVRQKLADGSRVSIGRAGALAQPRREAHRRVGVGEALSLGASQTVGAAGGIVTLLKQLLTGEISARNLGGIISIGEASGQSASLGFDVWLLFLGLFSVNLAVVNLLPIPILDGGHLMFIAAEAVRGRPLSVETRIRLSQVGLVIVVALMLFANGNDLVRKIFGL